MLQNARVTAFTVSELLRVNQGGGDKLPPTQIRVNCCQKEIPLRCGRVPESAHSDSLSLSLSEVPEIYAKVIDGTAIINMLKPRYGKTFRDYAINTFVPYVSSLLRQVERADLVWDRYFAEYLQNCTRGKRGVGVRRKLADNCLLS